VDVLKKILGINWTSLAGWKMENKIIFAKFIFLNRYTKKHFDFVI
jgi:hypothetical protein